MSKLGEAIQELKAASEREQSHSLLVERDRLDIHITGMRGGLADSRATIVEIGKLMQTLSDLLTKVQATERERLQTLQSALTNRADIERKIAELGVE